MTHAPDCQVHRRHSPHVAEPDLHHIWPKGQGGPDVPANRVSICPTGHRNVHELLRLAFKYGGVELVPWEQRRLWPPAERRLARMGHRAIMGDPVTRRQLSGQAG